MARTNLHLKLEALVEDYAPIIRNAFLLAIADISDSVILRDLIKAIDDGDPTRAFLLMGIDDASLRPITDAIETAFSAGGVITAEAFPKRIRTVDGARFRFNMRAPRAEKWLREESASKLVKGMQDQAQTLVQDVLARGVTDGRNPRSIALDLVGRIDRTTGRREGGAIGLTPRQETWVAQVRADLENLDKNYFTRTLRNEQFDKIVQRAIDANKPLSTAEIEKLVGQYRNNALRYRGEVVGRSEAIESLNRGQYESLRQGVDTGAIKQSAVKRVWDSAGNDGRTRDSHLAMEKQTELAPVGLDEPFVFPSGANLMFPGDRITSTGDAKAIAKETIQCRCRVRIDVDWFAGL